MAMHQCTGQKEQSLNVIMLSAYTVSESHDSTVEQIQPQYACYG